jgi:hypothetical protein
MAFGRINVCKKRTGQNVESLKCTVSNELGRMRKGLIWHAIPPFSWKDCVKSQK